MAGSTYPFTDGSLITAAGQNAAHQAAEGKLGEVRMFALSMSGAITKSTLQGQGWAICDGTTPASQGISSPTIATTPNLEDKFIAMSSDETSGTTGGANTIDVSHQHTLTITTGTSPVDFPTSSANGRYGTGSTRNTNTGGDSAQDNRPAFYEMAFFIKVKLIA